MTESISLQLAAAEAQVERAHQAHDAAPTAATLRLLQNAIATLNYVRNQAALERQRGQPQ